MNRQIICTNNNGSTITFGSSFAPFLLESADGLYKVSNNVYVADHTSIDGATYQGSVVEKRNIVLTLRDKSDHLDNRNELYRLFMPKTKGTLTYVEDNTRKQIDYYVESVVFDSSPRVRTATVSLICPDPFFAAMKDTSVEISGWKSLFEFEHDFEEEEFAQRLASKLAIITNTTGVSNIGLTIDLYANGEVSNPSVTLVETGEYVKVGTEAHPLSMVTGDVLTITTGTNNKKIALTHAGTKAYINEYLDEGSTFLQLRPGTNSIGFDADSGDDNLTVTVTYRMRYLGA